MKKTSLAFALTAVLLLSACSGNGGTQSQDFATLPDNSTSMPVYDEDSDPADSASDSETGSAGENSDSTTDVTTAEPAITFGKGVWESVDRIFTFYDDKSGNVLEKNTMTGVAFDYESDSNGLVFHLGSADTNVYTTAVAENENTILLTWEDGTAETLRYISGREFSGLRAGTWKSDSNTYTFYSETDGNMVSNAAGMGVGFTFDRTENGLMFHLGDASDNTPAATEVIDDNTVTLTWEDGSAETLTYVPVSGFTGFTAGQWTTGDAVYTFNADKTGTESLPDNSASISFSYGVFDDIIIFETYEPSTLIAAVIVSVSDDTVVLRTSNSGISYFTYIGAAE